MKWLFILVSVVCITFPIFQVEEHRFQDCYGRCFKRSKKNQLLLVSDVCTDEFLKFELDGDQVRCSQAQKENELGVFRCAATMWWQEGEISALYNRVFKSTMMLYAIILPCLFYIIYQFGAYYSDMRRENKFFSERSKFTDKLLKGQQYYVSNSRERRRHKQRHNRRNYYIK